KENKIINKITSSSLKKLLALLESADKQAERAFAVILAVFFAVSVPSGVSMLCRDIAGSFSSAKNTAEYISDNFEEDAVFVILRCGLPELSIYDPAIRLYAAGSGELCTYAKWEYMYRPPHTADEVIEDISQYEHLYIIHYYEQVSDGDDILYVGEGMTGFDIKNSLVIREYSDELIKDYLYFGV
ncbi:MAG: hypothetical protein K2G32_11325, partial [Oscillospiraceae bacterium]|nr:hypothetical protein [Oscillospiraceae bacterium]